MYNSLALSLYSYAHLNPLMLIDPDGNDVAVPIYFRRRTNQDTSAHRGNYGVIGFRTYDYSSPQAYEAAKAAGTLTKPIGGFEVSADAFSKKMKTPERGKTLGDNEKWAQVNDISSWGTKHGISITDIGKKGQDKLTVTKDGKETIVSAERIHYGGPFFSEGCLTSPDASYQGEKGKKSFESFIKEQLPSLKSSGEEGTYIQLPARGWWDYYKGSDN